jgi:putative ABC transport system substrate-binding protein
VKRRDFVTLIGGAAIAWPLAAGAQQRAQRVPLIGFLHPGLSDGSSVTYAALIDGLREIGYVDGQTVKIEARWGQGKPDTMPPFARELVALKVEALIAVARPAIAAARAASHDVPIIALDLESDPVASGFAQNIAKPGQNLTGLFLDAPTLCGKWLQLIDEVVPRVSRIAVLWDSTTGPYQLDAIKAAARAKSVEVAVIEFHELKGLDTTLDVALKDRPQALVQLGSPLTNMAADQIVGASRKYGIPGISEFRSFSQSGGLMSYGPDLRHMFRRAAPYVSRILGGTKAADLPIERPTKYELVINLKAAKALGLSIPTTLLATADEVIE